MVSIKIMRLDGIIKDVNVEKEEKRIKVVLGYFNIKMLGINEEEL